MSAYIKYFQKCFKANFAYRFDCMIGIVNTIVQIFIYVAIWRSLYAGRESVHGVSLPMIVTNFILSVGLSNVFWMDDFAIQRKIMKGEITNELLKPVSFGGLIFAENFGGVCARLIMNFFPALVFAMIFMGMLPPASVAALLLSLVSVFLGFLVLYGISYLTSLTSFWITNIWSLSTIKNVFVAVLSGSIMPIWFMPEWIKNLLSYTPFDSIYFIPVSLYLGNFNGAQVAYSLLKQLLCIACIYALTTAMNRRAVERLVIQGG